MNKNPRGLPMNLPTPDHIAILHSQELIDLIRAEIKKKGKITFARYMELALYAPGLGYYSAGAKKFSQGGDFVTAPEISLLFAACLARQCQQVLSVIGGGDVFEFGAGSGKLARDLLLALENLDSLPEHYTILEVSADLKSRQKTLLKESIPHLYSRVIWLDQLPEQSLSGVVIANEVLDAMPIHRFCVEEKIKEYYVTWKGEHFEWYLDDARSKELVDVVESLSLSQDYTSEVNLMVSPWLSGLAESLNQAVVLLIDYGFPRHEYYHSERSMGTLMCHYQHHAHDDPFVFPGLQDITAHVDFTAVAEAALEHQFSVSGFTSQANFLINCGLAEVLSSFPESLEINQQVKRLTMPDQMGELFKVMALTKQFDEPLIGFQHVDRRMSL